MPVRRPAVPLALAALSGAALGPHVPSTLAMALAAAGPMAGLLALRRRGRLASGVAATLLLAGVGGLAGAWAGSAAEQRARLHPDAPPWPGRPVRVEGRLLARPAPAGPGRVRLLISAGASGGAVLVEAPARAVPGQATPGARVQALGRFMAAAPAQAPGAFDRAAALRRVGAAARLSAVEVQVAPAPPGGAAFLSACVRQARHVIGQGARPRHAAFLRAVLLGERGGVDRAAMDAFRRTGTAHLLSISGLHVTALATLVLLLARALGLRRLEQALAVTACVALYASIAGAAVPTVRAAAAGAVGVALVGRGDAWNRLAVGLLAALAVEPLAALEVGTVLSFGTVAGLLLLEPVVRHALRRDDPLGRARPGGSRAAGLVDRAVRLVPASLAAFVASAPLMAMTLGQLPPAALVLNPPCIALFSLGLALGVAGVLVGALLPALGAWIVGLADAPLGLLFALVEAGATLPDAQVVPPPSPVAVVAAGLVALAVARRGRRGAAPLLGVGAALLLGLTLPRPTREGAPLAPPRAAAGHLTALSVGRAVILGAPDGALGVGPRPPRVEQLLDRACGTRRLRWLEDGAEGARLPGARIVVLGPGLVRVETPDLLLLVLAGDAPRGTEALARASAGLLRADVVLAPRARPAQALALVRRSGARRALVPPGCPLPPGIARLQPAGGAVQLAP